MTFLPIHSSSRPAGRKQDGRAPRQRTSRLLRISRGARCIRRQQARVSPWCCTSGSTRRRQEERFEVIHRVRFSSGEEFLSEYAENLSRGGMYLVTEESLKPGTVLQARLEIPGLEKPIELKGTVAYRVGAEQSFEQGRAPGVGIKFLELDPEARQRLDHYLTRLKIHRQKLLLPRLHHCLHPVLKIHPTPEGLLS